MDLEAAGSSPVDHPSSPKAKGNSIFDIVLPAENKVLNLSRQFVRGLPSPHLFADYLISRVRFLKSLGSGFIELSLSGARPVLIPIPPVKF